MIPKGKNTKATIADVSTARKALPSWLSIMLIVLLLAAISVAYWVRWHQPNTLTPAQTPELLQTQKELSSYFKQHPERMNLMDKRSRMGGAKENSQNQ